MSRRVGHRLSGRAAFTAALALAVALSAQAAPAMASGPIQTAVADCFCTSGADVTSGLARMHKAGATVVRFYIGWNQIAPQTPPANFNPTNPGDPAYDFTPIDTAVKLAEHDGLQPLLSVEGAPTWAEGSSAGLNAADSLPGTVRPDPTAFGEFAEAIARRYSGSFDGLPRVRYWQAWNEPNHHLSLNPQFQIGPTQTATPSTPMLSPEIYRGVLNAFVVAVHRVHGDNVVVAGGLAPFFRPEPSGRAAAPMPFMRQLLCMSAANRPLPRCNRVSFDVWAMDPYTSGNPEHHANSANDVSFGDLPRVAALLRAAYKAHHIISSHRPQFWITEFSWDSKPPDAYGVPPALETRWVAEAIYRAWVDGITLFSWFQIRDDPDPAGFQSGLYFACANGPSCDRPKPILAAFRFPFVAYRHGRNVLVWGRTPWGRPGTVVVQQRMGGAWNRLATMRTDRYGVFTATLSARGSGDLRAMLARSSVQSAPFSLHVPPDYPVNPFGHSPPNEESKPK
jgi:hypothetical protein